jgi:hypothetical protein
MSPSFQPGQGKTYVLVRDDLDILNMTRGLKNLTQNFLGHSLVQSANVEGALVRLRGGATEATCAGGRHDTSLVRRSGRGDSSRDRVGVLRDMERWRGHRLAILASFKARGASTSLRRRRQLARVGGSTSVGHIDRSDVESSRRGRYGEMEGRNGQQR